MRRRQVLRNGLFAAGTLAAGGTMPLAALPWPKRDGDLKITGVRLVETKPKGPQPSTFFPNPTWITPVSIYPKHRGDHASWKPDPGLLDSFTVEVRTNKGVVGYGHGGAGGGPFVEHHLKKLLLEENPLDVEKLWDIMWRSTWMHGRKGAIIHAISGVDLALWDLIGKVWEVPVYRLLGGETKAVIPAYATGNDYDWSISSGFTKVKLVLEHGPADGRGGLKKTVEFVKRVRDALGPDGAIMLDCVMGLTEDYTLELAEALERYRIYWIEEALPPDDYEGSSRLNAQIRSTSHRLRGTRIHPIRFSAVAGAPQCRDLAT